MLKWDFDVCVCVFVNILTAPFFRSTKIRRSDCVDNLYAATVSNRMEYFLEKFKKTGKIAKKKKKKSKMRCEQIKIVVPLLLVLDFIANL